MSTKGHLASTILFTNILINNNIILKSIEYTKNIVHNNFIKNIFIFFNNTFSFVLNIFLPVDLNLKIYILSFLFLILGTITPDLDYLLTKKFGNKNDSKAYLKYHRQYTHSFLIIVFSIIFIVLYLYIINYIDVNKYIKIVGLIFFYFLTGYSFHLIADIFFGKGGIPLLLKGNWNSTFPIRIKFYLFKNDGFIEKTIILLATISIFITFYNYYNNFYISFLNFIFLLLILFLNTSLKSFYFIIKSATIYIILLFLMSNYQII